ncbi:hypothetical protein, partial [Bradyrhizobium liaoningense]|uniref:hypothetical protein n=1 Tax=Bradyrhizobium liaoningense TaxID=43992 RepID=UPI0024E065A5
SSNRRGPPAVLDAYTLQARCVGRPHQVRGSVGLSYRLQMNSNDMTKRCNAMISKLNGDATEALLLKSVETVDQVAGHWDRDSIRTEPVSKALFEKFGQYYSG